MNYISNVVISNYICINIAIIIAMFKLWVADKCIAAILSFEAVRIMNHRRDSIDFQDLI